MQIVGADGWMDGGTVEIVANVEGAITRFELDYSLPWDGRPRHISVGVDGEKRIVPIGSDEETEMCSRIRGCLEDEYGQSAVNDALKNSPARKQAWDDFCASQEGLFANPAEFDNPYPLPFDGMWSYVFDFIEKAYREGKIS